MRRARQWLPAVEWLAGLQKDHKLTAVAVAAATAEPAQAAAPVDPAPKVRLADSHTYDPATKGVTASGQPSTSAQLLKLKPSLATAFCNSATAAI